MEKCIFIVILFIAGCATPRYTKSGGATQDDFMKDRYACLRETQQRIEGANVNAYGGSYQSTVRPPCGALAACLAAKGYYQSDNGELVVPKGAGIRCSH